MTVSEVRRSCLLCAFKPCVGIWRTVHGRLYIPTVVSFMMLKPTEIDLFLEEKKTADFNVRTLCAKQGTFAQRMSPMRHSFEGFCEIRGSLRLPGYLETRGFRGDQPASHTASTPAHPRGIPSESQHLRNLETTAKPTGLIPVRKTTCGYIFALQGLPLTLEVEMFSLGNQKIADFACGCRHP